MYSGSPSVVVLGTAQDGGRPQIGCYRPCCAKAWEDPSLHRFPAALGVQTETGERWLVEASPALPKQLHRFHRHAPRRPGQPLLDGLLLTHAHMGHLVGLAYLGTEAAAVRRLSVYLPTGLADRLREAVPWSALVSEGRLQLHPLRQGDQLSLSEAVTVEVLEVPHRREWSETLAFIISGPQRRVLFLPDIDDWESWPVSLPDLLHQVDVAWLDATFYADGELDRDMSAIPHPRVVDTMRLLSVLPAAVRARVRFSHLNHTNPLFDPSSAEYAAVRAEGFEIAWEGEVVEL